VLQIKSPIITQPAFVWYKIRQINRSRTKPTRGKSALEINWNSCPDISIGCAISFGSRDAGVFVTGSRYFWLSKIQTAAAEFSSMHLIIYK